MPSETLQSCIVNAATRLGTISTIASIDFQARRAHLVHDGRNLADICADRPQTSIKLMEAPAPISESSYILLVALSLPIETRLFRLRHRIAIRKRAQQIARMVTFISPIYKPKTMTGLSLAFPILGKSLMLLSGAGPSTLFSDAVFADLLVRRGYSISQWSCWHTLLLHPRGRRRLGCRH